MTSRAIRFSGAGLLVALALFVFPAVVAAQSSLDPTLPFRNLFEVSSTPPAVALTFTSSVFEGFDSHRQPTLSPTTDAVSILSGGMFTGVNPTVVLELNGRRVSFGVSGRTTLRYYNEYNSVLSLDRSATAGFRATFGRTALQLQQDVAYRPFYQFVDLPSLNTRGLTEFDNVTSDAAASSQSIYSYMSSARVSRQLGRYTWLTGGARYRFTQASGVPTPGLPAAVDQQQYDIAGVLMHRLSQHTWMRAGYATRNLGYSSNGHQVRTQEINVGLDRDQAFALGRNTRLTLLTGTSMVQMTGQTRYILAGTIGLDQRLSRDWALIIVGRHGLDVVEGLQQPLLANAVSVSVQGLLTRRLSVNGTYGYSQGRDSFDSSSRSYKANSAIGRVSFKINDHLNAYGEGFYYDQVTPSSIGLFTGSLNRGGVRGGVFVVLPLYSQQRGVE